MFINQHSSLLQPAATFAMATRAAELKAQGLPVISLSIGQPDFATPPHICEAAKQAIDNGITGYTPAGGLPILKDAVRAKFKRDQGVDYSAKEVTCSNGGKAILFNLFQVLLDPGDEVILSDPYWLSYATHVRWAAGVPVFVETHPEDDFCMKPEAVAAAITPKTKAILINSPANPTGGVMPAADLRAIGALAKDHDLLIISDDVYEFFYFGEEPPVHILKLMPELRDRTVLVNSVSKSYAMTGWRIGYAGGPAYLIGKMQALQSQEASNPCSVSQMAAVAALNGPQECMEAMRLAFARRRSMIAEALTGKIPHVLPGGAFYCMLDLRAFMKDGESDVDFCMRLLEEKHIAFVPGSAFGEVTKGWLRMSFALSDEELGEALQRLLSLA